MEQTSREVLIDTSILIAHVRGRLSIRQAIREYEGFYISAVTLYELEYGANRAGRESDFAASQEIFRPGILELGRNEADLAARMNGTLARRNQHIRPRDALIAATALQRGLPIITLNVNEFQRVPNLTVVSPP